MRTPSWDRAAFEAKRICAAVRRRECCAYQFADGFDNYNTASELYETVGGTVTYGTAYRRLTPPSGLPGQGVYLTQATGAYLRKNLQSSQSTFICKVAYCPQQVPASASQIIGVYDSGVSQIALCYGNAGGLIAYSGWEHVGGDIFLGETSPGLITTGNYYGIEVEFVISSGGGAVTVWLNGTQVLQVTGLSTNFSGSGTANQVQIGDGGLNCYFDDLRVWDNVGSYQSAPMGTDSRIITKLPTGAGAFTQWTPNGAAANYGCVDDNPPDGDTTYVSGATAGLQDAYAMPLAYLTLAPAMVVARSYVRKDDSNSRTMAIGVASSGIPSVGPTYTLASGYTFTDACIPLDPHTTAVWTAAAADAAQHYKEELS